MKKPRSAGQFRLEAADVAADNDRRYTIKVLTLCGVCPDWSHYGTPEDGKRAFTEHRNQEHPEAVDRGQQTRRRAAGQMSVPRQKPW